MGSRRLVLGVGINDVNGSTKNQYYKKWFQMLNRCYSDRYKEMFPTYARCSVCEEWLKFSEFKRWMESRDWVGKDLDKDILIPGNKVYSPETCVFVDHGVNLLMNDHASKRGEWPIGVSFHKRIGKFIAQCKDGTGKQIHLGYFSSPLTAHRAYVKFKVMRIKKIAEEYPELKVGLLNHASILEKAVLYD